MTDYAITQNALARFISRLSQHIAVHAPVTADGVTAFQRIDDAAQIALDYHNAVAPPKRLLFPQTETLFAYSRNGGANAAEPEQAVQRVIFGIRPCDARSVTLLDRVFGGDIGDPYYLGKRAQTTLIGLTCAAPGGNCFCASVGGSPAGTDGLDLLLTPYDAGFFAEVVTEKGAALITEHAELFSESRPEERERCAAVKTQAAQRIRRHVAVSEIPAALDALFSQAIWSDVSRACVGCSICAFLCPTCHCFDMQDENFGDNGVRVRVWDACANPEYTLHASGHNPRPGRMHRLRNRMYHKYSYFPKKYGEIACVGCGRCVTHCPVNIDIVDVLRQIANSITTAQGI